jgi:2-polyprenyl-3-methyl-5-hydroxy-6-metoxy-1,4-benzoquinol methylase
MAKRQHSFGTDGQISGLDRFGRFLSQRKLLRALGDVKGKTILDLGCGFDVGLSKRFLNSAHEIIAVDLEVDKSLALLNPNLRILEGYIPEILNEIPEKSVDIIIANNILEHLDSPANVLEILRNKFKEDFTFYFNVPSWIGRYALEYAAFELGKAPREEMVDHKTYFSKKDLWQLLVDSGMSPDEFKVKSHKFGLNTYAIRRKT